MPVELVLYEPEIPPNAGSVIRLCANTGARLHLVRPLGFSLLDRSLQRAGLDYREMAEVTVHRDWPACLAALAGRRVFAFSTRGGVRYDGVRYERGDVMVFGPETRGLPEALLDGIPAERRLRLPMRPASRSLNLANACAVAVYEAWRQMDYAGGN